MEYFSYYGKFGGQFTPEILHEVFTELTNEFNRAREDKNFWKKFHQFLINYSGRPTPLSEAKNLTKHLGGARIVIKREDLNHTGAHKINNVVGQGLLALKMGKKRLIAETGAGQHGVAVATISAKLGLDCTIYMGSIDAERQKPNVFWMEQLGAEVIKVDQGSKTLKDAINEAFRDWVNNPQTTHYLLGTACGPHPFPSMVAWFSSLIGLEAKEQILNQYHRLPKRVYACVGGGSNALGIFQAFLNDKKVELVGVEAAGAGAETNHHALRLAHNKGEIGIAQGYKTKFLQNSDGQMQLSHSIAAGLDYIGVSPILAHWHETGQARFEAASDEQVLQATKLLMSLEGIIPALESAHALVQAFKEASTLPKDELILINLSGRGDKDLFNFMRLFEPDF